ncbi:MAG TPA: hypothetical protein VM487_05085 [Phycisphaerae bacterium]|nr:hypothetical protein [Phycisphaerae bacterium]
MSNLANALFAMTATAARAIQHTPRPTVVAWGIVRGDERFYLCAENAECIDVAERHADRMPLTDGDLRVDTILFPDTKPIRCENCGIALTVYGPDPRD